MGTGGPWPRLVLPPAHKKTKVQRGQGPTQGHTAICLKTWLVLHRAMSLHSLPPFWGTQEGPWGVGDSRVGV